VRANVEGPYVLANLASRKGFTPVHYNTAYIFNGIKKMHKETDKTNPQSTYAKHKLAGEEAILEVGGIVLITDGLYGFGASRPHFVDAVAVKVTRDSFIPMVNDQIVSPTFTEDLAEMTEALVTSENPYGRYNAVNAGSCSKVGLTKRIIKILGVKCLIKPMSTSAYNRKFRKGQLTAKRPRNSSLDITKLKKIYSPRHWEDALEDYLTSK